MIINQQQHPFGSPARPSVQIRKTDEAVAEITKAINMHAHRDTDLPLPNTFDKQVAS